jgi:LDH2 family malate/lactate/ureidoglycolate dehydrogenase
LYEPPLPPVQTKLAGALLPASGHKGYGLALVVAILTGALTGTACDPEITSGLTNAVYINVVRIDRFVSLQDFKDRVDRLIRTVKKSQKAEGFSEIFLPGEVEIIEEEKRSKNGIVIPDMTWQALVDLSKEYGLEASKLVSA